MVQDSSPGPRSVPSRRDVLAATAVTATTLLGGCRGLPFSEPEVRTGHLFVQNREDRPIEIALSVASQSDGGDPVVGATYQVPANHVLQFEGVLDPGTTYEIRANQPAAGDQPATSVTVDVETCAAEDPSEKVDVAVTVSSDGPEISVFNCQTPYTRTGELTYVAADDHRIGTPAGTAASRPRLRPPDGR